MAKEKQQKRPSLKVAALSLRKAIAAYNSSLSLVTLAEKNLNIAQEHKIKARHAMDVARGAVLSIATGVQQEQLNFY